jgi:hypothetical protein
MSRLATLAVVFFAGASVAYFGGQANPPPALESHAAAAPAPKAEPVAVTELPFVLTATSTCTCANCKCKTEPAKVEPVKAAPLYTQPAPVAKPKAAPVRYATHRLEYRATYGRFGRQTGGHYVYVPIQQPRQYQPQQRYYRSCSNGSCR